MRSGSNGQIERYISPRAVEHTVAGRAASAPKIPAGVQLVVKDLEIFLLFVWSNLGRSGRRRGCFGRGIPKSFVLLDKGTRN